jgi:ribosomal protein L40E
MNVAEYYDCFKKACLKIYATTPSGAVARP